MNPAIFAGVLVALLASSGGNKQQPKAPISSGAVVAVLIWTIIGPAFLFELAVFVDALARRAFAEALVALVFTIATAIVLFPWPIARTLLIPRGRVKLAWAVTRLSFWVWSRDVRGGAVIAASWAAIRRAQRRGPNAELLEWIERRRDAKPVGSVRWRLGGAGIVATGLLAEARRDRASARRLLSSATEPAEPTRPTQAVALASEWLCAEAMERGAWREVEFLARTAPLLTRRLRLFGCVAGRLTGIAPLPSDLRLWSRWLLAPNRIANLALLRRALATATTTEQRATEQRRRATRDTADDDPLVSALTLHSLSLTRDPDELDRDDLAQLGLAWDRALADPSLERRLLERGLALGTHEHQRSPAQLAELVRDDLLALVRAAGLELGQLCDTSELLDQAARRLHAELLDDLEITAAALHSRVKAKRELPPIDEWQTFLALREQYAAAVAVGGLELRRHAFAEVHGPVCALAVWLWNERTERALGNAIFHWLLAEAIVVDDAEAIQLQERNVDCGV